MASYKLTREAVVSSNGTQRVLLIQEERALAETFTSATALLHVETSWAQSGLEGLARARLTRFDLLCIDLDLPDIPGVAVINALRATDAATRFIVISGAVTAAVARDALGWGSLGVLGKPYTASDVTSAVVSSLRPAGWSGGGLTPQGESALQSDYRGWSPHASAPRSVAERWAVLILRTMELEGDPKTIGIWARSMGVSRSALCECCRLMHVSPHDARDFARLMRAIHRSNGSWQPETLLDLADARTLKKLLSRAGLVSARATPSLFEFLECQEWIPKGNPGLYVLRELLGVGRAPGRVTTDAGDARTTAPH